MQRELLPWTCASSEGSVHMCSMWRQPLEAWESEAVSDMGKLMMSFEHDVIALPVAFLTNSIQTCSPALIIPSLSSHPPSLPSSLPPIFPHLFFSQSKWNSRCVSCCSTCPCSMPLRLKSAGREAPISAGMQSRTMSSVQVSSPNEYS